MAERPKASREAVRQAWLMAFSWLGAAIVVLASALGIAFPPPERDLLVGALLAAGLVVQASAAAFVAPHGPTARRSVTEIVALRDSPTSVKVFALLARLLAFVGATLLVISALVRTSVFQSEVSSEAIRRGVFLLTIVLATSLAYVQQATVRRPQERPPGLVGRVLQGAGVAAVLAAAALVAWMAVQPDQGTPIALGIEAHDFPFVAMAGVILAAVAMAGSRALPSLASLVGLDQRAGAHGMAGKRNVVFLPVVLAFVLLFLVFLLFMLFGVGVAGAVDEILSSPVLLGGLVFLVAAFAVSLLAAFRLARSQAKQAPLYKKLVDAKRRRERILMGVSALGAILLLAPAFLLFQGYTVLGFEPDAWVHFLCLGLLVAIGPYGFYVANEGHRVRLLEERFPDFLRDVASSHKGGLTLAQSVAVASRGEYGPLSPEVRRMADQLSWNVPFNEALERFGGRVQTPLVQRAVSLILEANRSGGATTDVLLAAARDAREIKFLEQERRINMSLYTVVIYVTFFVFLGVTAVLYSQFVPQLVASSRAAEEAALRLGQGSIAGINSNTLDLKDFQLFYFMAALMQGLGDGIVAGMMGSGKAVLGLRHSFVMVLLSYVTFVFLIA